jgi:hypothetical protein
MAETVKVPGIGQVKKGYVFGGVAVLAGILAVAYYRHSQSTAASAASTTATDPTANTNYQDPNAIDPNTGLTYGEEAAGIQSGDLSGYGTPYGDTSGLIGYDSQGNPIYADTVGYGPSPSFTTNGNWAQAAESYLVSTTGADAGTVSAALGTYIAGQPLTSAQATIVRSAQAFFGTPPQSGSNGYPPALRLVSPPDTTPPPVQTPPPPVKTPPPKTTPPPPAAKAPGMPGGVHATRVTRTGMNLAWNKVTGATQYKVRLTYQEPGSGGSGVVGNKTVSSTSTSISGLTPNHTYTVHVAAGNKAGWSGETNGPAVKTSK